MSVFKGWCHYSRIYQFLSYTFSDCHR